MCRFLFRADFVQLIMQNESLDSFYCYNRLDHADNDIRSLHEAQPKDMKRETLDARIVDEQVYLDHVEMSLAAAAAAAHHHNTPEMRHPNSRISELENIHKGNRGRTLVRFD